MDGIINILFNIIGGILTIPCVAFIYLIKDNWVKRKYKNFFGVKLPFNDYYLVYGEFKLRDDLFNSKGESVPYPIIKIDRDNSIGFNITPVSAAELRATKYLVESFSKHIKKTPKITNDYEIKSKVDISFITLRGPAGNFKSEDILENDACELITFDGDDIKSKISGETIDIMRDDSKYNYGLIIKIHPIQFPNRQWFLCTGIGECGTSGSAWYLSNKWNKLSNKYGKSSFITILRINPGQDESATPVFSTNDKNHPDIKKWDHHFGSIDIEIPEIDVLDIKDK